MPGSARNEIVREGEIGIYHTWSKCVQGAFLCGQDFISGNNYEHRRGWLQELIRYQAGVFGVDVGNYTILSNHFHLIARLRPDLVELWSDREVAWRWKCAWPKWDDKTWSRQPTDQEIDELLSNPVKLAFARKNLSSLSWFMARVKEPIAKFANQESETQGHFFEQRFGSREILDEPGLLACSWYLDVNQIVAGISQSLDTSDHSAIQDRVIACRLREAELTVDKFHGKKQKRTDLELDVDQVAKMFADCSLSPITTEGPLLLVPERTVPTTQTESGKASEELQDDDPLANASDDSNDARQASLDDTRIAPKEGSRKPTRQSKPKKTTGKKPSYSIHRYYKSRAAARASDNVFVNMPWTQYENIAQWLAQSALLGSDSRKPSQELTLAIEKTGLVADRLLDTVTKFERLFGLKVGNEGSMRDSLAGTTRRWLQGIRSCREAFT